MEGHGRSRKVKEGQRRFPIIGLTSQMRKVIGGGGGNGGGL